MNFNDRERDLLTAALQMKICFIETGDPLLNARDIQAGHKGKIKQLDEHQQALIEEMQAIVFKLQYRRNDQ